MWLRQHQQPLVVLMICLVTVGLGWNRACQHAERQLSGRLNGLANDIGAEIASQFETHEQMLHVGRALFDASDHVSRSDWQVFVTGMDLERHAPGVMSLGFVERVERDRVAAFEAEARADGAPEFRVRRRSDADRAPDEGDAYVVKYSEPRALNHRAWGVDVGSLACNRETYDNSAAAMDARIAIGFSLVQAPAPNRGLVMTLPVLDKSNTGPAVVRGWVSATVLVESFVDATWNPEWDGFVMELVASSPDGDTSIFATQPGEHGSDPGEIDRSRAMIRTMEKFGRTISVRVVPASASLTRPDRSEAFMVLLVGGLATALLTLIVWSVTRTRQHAVAIALQMTESLRKSETAQRELARRAEDANQAKSAFLANMSHEIRTPMTAILGYADLIAEPGTDDRTRTESVDAVRRSGKHLLNIINDVLDISKIESGHMEMFEEPCGLRPLFGDMLAGLANRATSRGNTLLIEVCGAVPDTVRTDAHRLRQILFNLVGNAIKFTEDGTVTLHVSHADGVLRVAVEDSGLGIPEDKLEAIFRPFEQADTSSSRRYEGTGLGLTISRRLAELLGGAITATSEVGVGSTFELCLPAPATEDAEAVRSLTASCPPPAAVPFVPVGSMRGRVLLAEDGPDNQRLISFILRKAGLQVDLANNGREAIELMESGVPYELIITDMQMPEMDGYEATRQLRSMGYTLPILALTAHAMAGDRERCVEAGCDDYETKPIDRASLLSTVERLLKNSAGRRRRAA